MIKVENRIEQSFDIVESLLLPNNMFKASPHSTYGHIWLRDNCFIIMAYINKKCLTFEKTIWSILDMFKFYEKSKLDYHIKTPPQHTHEFIHARYSADDFREIDVEWNHRQNDSVGIVLYCIGEALKKGKKVLRDEHDKRIVQKLVRYLEVLEYWKCPDGGAWEEINEVRSSSIGTCVAGLKSVKDIVNVPEYIINKGMTALYELFPYETPTRKYDLAQLFLVYYGVFCNEMNAVIVKQIEENLLRDRGVLRYVGDSYYSTLEQEHGRGMSRKFYESTEAEWCFGFSYLSIAHCKLGNFEKAKYYLEKSESVMLPDGSVPELYYAKTDKYNVNSPLCWSQSMYIQAYEELEKASH